FQKVFAGTLRMEDLARSLESSKSDDEWWRHLTAAAREWHWTRIEWRGPSGSRSETFSHGKTEWSFTAALPGGDAIEIEGASCGSGPSPDLIALSSILSRTFERGIGNRQPALS
ncbi:MAG: hypothetical protein KGN84_11415, partial [Acidobacteriota bacterium]|nr:hypothetical protein [Acidobacteriota bacterium]